MKFFRILKFNNVLRSLTHIFVGAIVFVIIVGVLFTTDKNKIIENLSVEISHDIDDYSSYINERVVHLSSDLFLMETVITDSLLFETANNDSDLLAELDKAILETRLSELILLRESYKELRVVDTSGNELVSIVKIGRTTSISPEYDLKDLSETDYFNNTINLSGDFIYISNITFDSGDTELSQNPTPSNKVIKPLVNYQGTKVGFLIVTQDVTNSFHTPNELETSRHSAFEVINEDGYFLHSINEDIEFGFLDSTKVEEVFSKHHSYKILEVNGNGITQEIFGDEIYTSVILSDDTMSEAIRIATGRDIIVILEYGDLIIFGEIEYFETNEYLVSRTTYLVLFIVLLSFTFIIIRLFDESEHGKQLQLKSMEYSLNHDILTNLPNRKSVFDSIKYILSRGHPIIVMFIDFDDFKYVNDNFGHKTGDKVLVEGSLIMKNTIRRDDILARLGGDEFLIVLNNLEDVSIAIRIAKELIEKFKVGFNFDGIKCSVGLSIGIACSKPGINFDEIISNADDAMYHTKNIGKNGFSLYSKIINTNE